MPCRSWGQNLTAPQPLLVLGVPLSLLGNRPFLFLAGILPLCVCRTTKPGVRVASTPSPRPPRPSGHKTTAQALLFPQPGTNTPRGSVHADEALVVSVLCVLDRWVVACKEHLQQGGPVLMTAPAPGPAASSCTLSRLLVLLHLRARSVASWSCCVFMHAQSPPGPAASSCTLSHLLVLLRLHARSVASDSVRVRGL